MFIKKHIIDIINKTIELEDGSHPIEKVGGGLFVYVNSPKVNNCEFLDNGDNNTDTNTTEENFEEIAEDNEVPGFGFMAVLVSLLVITTLRRKQKF